MAATRLSEKKHFKMFFSPCRHLKTAAILEIHLFELVIATKILLVKAVKTQ